MNADSRGSALPKVEGRRYRGRPQALGEHVALEAARLAIAEKTAAVFQGKPEPGNRSPFAIAQEE